ncbi:hypothetical protein ACLOJK_036135 [Asimina triloba]
MGNSMKNLGDVRGREGTLGNFSAISIHALSIGRLSSLARDRTAFAHGRKLMAAYKGFSGTIRLLLFRDAQQGKQDKEAIDGDPNKLGGCWAEELLLSTRNELLVEDKAGFTPAQLASDKGHKHVAFFLEGKSIVLRSNRKAKQALGCLGDVKQRALGCLGDVKQRALGCLGDVKQRPKTSNARRMHGSHFEDKFCIGRVTAVVGLWGWTAVSLAFGTLLMFYRCSSEVDRVDQAGAKNKWDFVMFLFMATLASFVSAVIAVQRSWLHHVVTKHPGAVSFLVIDLICFLAGTILIVVQASQIARNITTNEVANAARYGYLRGPEGRFRNPYNHGFRKNCTDFLIQGYNNDEELAWPSLQEAAN